MNLHLLAEQLVQFALVYPLAFAWVLTMGKAR